jgi:hypothetical protein
MRGGPLVAACLQDSLQYASPGRGAQVQGSCAQVIVLSAMILLHDE